jgi:hypothetical protein
MYRTSLCGIKSSAVFFLFSHQSSNNHSFGKWC